jgi:hypothetical protein
MPPEQVSPGLATHCPLPAHRPQPFEPQGSPALHNACSTLCTGSAELSGLPLLHASRSAANSIDQPVRRATTQQIDCKFIERSS